MADVQFGSEWGVSLEDETGVADTGVVWINSLPLGGTVIVWAVYGGYFEQIDTITSSGQYQYSTFGYEIAVSYSPGYNDNYIAGTFSGSIALFRHNWPFYKDIDFSTIVTVTQNPAFPIDDVGTSGADLLFGDDADNDLIGLGGDDVMAGSLGADQMNGGDGNDTVDYRMSNAAVTVALGGSVSGGHAQGDTLVSVENIIGSGFADLLYGNDAANVIRGDAGSDWLYGYGGDDILYGGPGQDGFVLGAGADLVVLGLDDGVNNIIYDFNADEDRIDISAFGHWISWEINQIEVRLGFDSGVTLLIKYLTQPLTAANFVGLDMIFPPAPDPPPVVTYDRTLTGTIGANTLTGDDRADLILSGTGNDTLYGMGGNDRLEGGADSDKLFGGDGDDLLFGGTGTNALTGGTGADIFVFSRGAGNNTITDFTVGQDKIDVTGYGGYYSIGTSATGARIGFADNGFIILKGVAWSSLTAADFIGTATVPVLSPPPPPPVGDERTLVGTVGANTLTGDARRELIQGMDGNDTLYGMGGADRLEGGTGGDKLFGGDGNDVLVGGAGQDTLTGGAGADRFVLAPGDGANTIADFEDGVDRIDISAYGGYSSIVQLAAGAKVIFADGGYVILTGFHATDLSAADFVTSSASPADPPKGEDWLL